MSTSLPARRRLGELLIEAGVLDEERLKSALAEQKKWGGKLGRTLVEMGFVDEDSMMRSLSRQLTLQAIDLDTAQLPPNVVQFLRVDLCERYGIFPLGGDPKTRTLQLATSDPTNTEAIHELSVATNARIVCHVATGSAIDRAIRRYYYGEGSAGRPQSGAPGIASFRSEGGPVLHAPATPSASLELDELLGNAPTDPRQRAYMPPPPLSAPADEGPLKREVASLKARIDELEKVTATQVKALRGLIEQLIESGLISRAEYQAKVQKPD